MIYKYFSVSGSKGYCRPLHVPLSLPPHAFFWLLQQIEFIIHTNIQPHWQFFFTQGQGHRSKVKVKASKKTFADVMTIMGSLQFFM